MADDRGEEQRGLLRPLDEASLLDRILEDFGKSPRAI